jgi:hypothetical protein
MKQSGKMKIRIQLSVLAALFATACHSCSDEPYHPEIEATEHSQQWNSCVLTLSSDELSRSNDSDTAVFENGDLIALRFKNVNSANVIGYALFDSDQNCWNAKYKGSLSDCSVLSCEVVYLGNHPDFTEHSTDVQLSPETGVYETAEGRYSFSGNTICVVATLKPKTARVRFVDTKASQFQIKGVEYIQSFDINNWSFTYSSAPDDAIAVSVSLHNGQYTSPYYYVVLPRRNGDKDTDKAHSSIWLKSGSYVYLHENFLNDAITNGASGELMVPSDSSHKGWIKDTYQFKKYSNVSFTCSSSSPNGWTQTQSSHKFTSTVGVHLTYNYRLSIGYNSSEKKFQHEIWAHDDTDSYKGSGFGLFTNGFGYHSDNLINYKVISGKDLYYSGFYYVNEADYYHVQWYTYALSFTASNITMSNF